MALIYDATLQSQIALRLARKTFSDLSTNQKLIVDGNWSAGSAGGAAGRAYTTLQQYANYFNLTDADAIPDAWERWFIALACADAAHAFSTAEDEDLVQEERAARLDAISSFSLVLSDAAVDSNDLGLTVDSLRRYVYSRATSGPEPLFPQVSIVDTSIEEVVRDLWNTADWSFRTQEVSIALATNGDVTFTPTVTLDKVASPELLYTDSRGGRCLLADDEMIRQYRSMSNLTTGKPEYFRTTKSGNTVSLLFNRDADQAYTMKGKVTIRLPSMTSEAEFNTALALFPSEFVTLIRDWVLGSVLTASGSRRAASVLDKVDQRLEHLIYTADATEAEEKEDSHRTGGRRHSLGGPRWGDLGGCL